MKPSELTSVLVKALPAGRKVLVVSGPGCGKSDIVAQAAAAAGFALQISHPAVSDPTDYKGMPAILPSNNGNAPTAEFLPFGDLQRLITADVPTACFLDDIGQAPHAVQAALMQLILARRVNGHRISDHVTFVGATNDSSHRAGVNALLEPVKSRFDTIVQLEPTVDDWCAWAFKNDMPSELIAFIRFRPELLNKFEPTREMKNSPCPRTVSSVGTWFNLGVMNPEVLAGCAGEGFATEFIGFQRVYRSLPSLDAILLDPVRAVVPTDPSALYAVTAGLTRKMAAGNAARVLAYAARMPDDFHLCLVRDATNAHPWFPTSAPFTAWAAKHADWLT